MDRLASWQTFNDNGVVASTIDGDGARFGAAKAKIPTAAMRVESRREIFPAESLAWRQTEKCDFWAENPKKDPERDGESC